MKKADAMIKRLYQPYLTTAILSTKPQLLLLCALLLCFFTSTAINAESSLTPYSLKNIESSEHQDISLIPHSEVHLDHLQQLVIDDILELQEDAFIPVTEAHEKRLLKFGERTDWVRVTVQNGNSDALERLVEMDQPLMNQVSLYVIIDGKVVDYYYTGEAQGFDRRPFIHRTFVFPIKFPAQSQVELYFRLQGGSLHNDFLRLWDGELFHLRSEERSYTFGIFSGFAIAFTFFNLFMAIVFKRHVHLYFAGQSISTCLLLMNINGYAYQYLWPNMPSWNESSLVFFTSSIFVFIGICNHILLKLSQAKIQRVVNSVFIAISVFVLLSSVTVAYGIALKMIFPNILLTYLVTLGLSLLRVREVRFAPYHFVASLLFFVGISTILLQFYGVLPVEGWVRTMGFYLLASQMLVHPVAFLYHQHKESEQLKNNMRRQLSEEKVQSDTQRLTVQKLKKANLANRDIILQLKKSIEQLKKQADL